MSASSSVTNGTPNASASGLPREASFRPRIAGDLDLAQLGAMLEDEARDDAAADDADPHARILPRGLPELPAPA